MFCSQYLHSKLATAAMRFLFLLLIAMCASARGQESQERWPIIDHDPHSEASGQVVVQSAPEIACDDGYWFVSTHKSPQSFHRTGPKFCPVVSRYEDCSSFRKSDFGELTSQLVPGVPVCIVIHGSFVDMPNAAKESICTWKWLKSGGLGQPVQVIYFYWPSFKPISLTVQNDVNLLGRQAARNGFYLADLIQNIPPECPTSLVGHSHGTRVIAAGLHLMAGGVVQGLVHRSARATGRRIRSVFMASAIDHDWLNPGHRYDRALCSVECLLNLTNNRDRALRVYPLRLPLIARCPLGLSGLTETDRYRLGGYSGKVVDWSVANAIGPEHLWPYYFGQPKLALTMRNYIYFGDQPEAFSVVETQPTTRH